MRILFSLRWQQKKLTRLGFSTLRSNKEPDMRGETARKAGDVVLRSSEQHDLKHCEGCSTPTLSLQQSQEACWVLSCQSWSAIFFNVNR